jgi:hypothetical protein
VALLLESAGAAAVAFAFPPLVPSVPGPPVPNVPFAPGVPAVPLSTTVAASTVESDKPLAITDAKANGTKSQTAKCLESPQSRSRLDSCGTLIVRFLFM